MRAETSDLGKEKNIPIGEIGDLGGIEPVSENDFMKGIGEKRFMNQLLTIRVARKSEKGSLPYVNPGVNGVNQLILRGYDSVVKRKYVEALARSTYTEYTQQKNPLNPADIRMVPHKVLNDPFEVLKDPSKYGREWLESILKAA